MSSIESIIFLTPEQLQENIRQAVRAEFEVCFKQTQQLPKEEPYLTIKDVCSLLGVSEATIHAWKKTGELPFHRIGRRVYFLASEIRATAKPVNRKHRT